MSPLCPKFYQQLGPCQSNVYVLNVVYGQNTEVFKYAACVHSYLSPSLFLFFSHATFVERGHEK